MIKKIMSVYCVIVPIFIFFCHDLALAHTHLSESKCARPLEAEALPKVFPVNILEYKQQIELIKRASPTLYRQHQDLYLAIDRWLDRLNDKTQLSTLNMMGCPLGGDPENERNVHLTGYYIPVIKARRDPDPHFRYPLYRMPTIKHEPLPTRAQIYEGALAGENLEIAYTASLIDNFLMQVQGSGYIDFENNSPLQYFAFSGKNGHPYQGIGRLLVEQGHIRQEEMSMQAIKNWAEKTEEKKVIELLKQNDSFVFFEPKSLPLVLGAAGVPLVAKTAVASDRILLPMGSVLLLEVPLLNNKGQFMGQREWRLVVVLDVGSAIRGYHLDLYQGIGKRAGNAAGYYNHYGRGWAITSTS